jgi:hypothetical protein
MLCDTAEFTGLLLPTLENVGKPSEVPVEITTVTERFTTVTHTLAATYAGDTNLSC